MGIQMNKAKVKKYFISSLKLYVVFCLLIFIIAILRKYAVIDVAISLVPFYVVALIIFLIAKAIFDAKMGKYFLKPFYKFVLVGVVGLALPIYVACFVEYRYDMISFLGHATKINAIVEDVEKKVEFVEGYCGVMEIKIGNRCTSINDRMVDRLAGDHYELSYIYNFRYVVDGETYRSKYIDKLYKKFDHKFEAENYGKKSSYNKGERMAIYYNNTNPQEVRKDVPVDYDPMYVFEILFILFLAYYIYAGNKFIDNSEIIIPKKNKK